MQSVLGRESAEGPPERRARYSLPQPVLRSVDGAAVVGARCACRRARRRPV